MPLSVRPTLPTDEQFLYRLVYETTAEQLFAWTWDPRIRDQLLDMQIRAKHGAYAVEFPNADYAIVMLDDQPVGRMIIDRPGGSSVLSAIPILPKHSRPAICTPLILYLYMD